MAYRSTGVPRFYIDQYIYLNSIGIDTRDLYKQFYSAFHSINWDDNPNYPGDGNSISPYEFSEVFTLTPNNQQFFSRGTNTGDKWWAWVFPTGMETLPPDAPNIGWYGAWLNHSLWDESRIEYNGVASAPLGIYHNFINYSDGGEENLDDPDIGAQFWRESGSYKPVLNVDGSGYVHNNGTTIITQKLAYRIPQFTTMGIKCNHSTHYRNNTIGHSIGGVSAGLYYDMPHSPDLKLSMETEFDGYDSITTLGGSTLTRQRYSGAPWWYDTEDRKVDPFSVYRWKNIPYGGVSTSSTDLEREWQPWTKRQGRRVWNLKFSYIDGSDMFSANPMAGTYMEGGYGVDYDDIDYQGNWGSQKIINNDFSYGFPINTYSGWDRNWNTHGHLSATKIAAINTAIGEGHDCTANMSVISGGTLKLNLLTEAQMDAFEDTVSDTANYGSSITTTSPNWRASQYDVFQINKWVDRSGELTNRGFEDDGQELTDGTSPTGWTTANSWVDTTDTDGDGNYSELEHGIGTTVVSRADGGYACKLDTVEGTPNPYSVVYQPFTFKAGFKYRIRYDIVDYTEGLIVLHRAGQYSSSTEQEADVSLEPMADDGVNRDGWSAGNSKFVDFVSAGTYNYLVIKRGTNPTNITIDNIKIYELQSDAIEEERLRQKRYKCRFRARQTTVVSENDRLQLGCGYYTFFDQHIGTEYEIHEREFRIGDRDNGTYYYHALMSSSSHMLSIGGYGSPNPWGAQWEFDWIQVYEANPDDVDFKYDMNTSASFESVVLNKIGNGQKFIFQPDNTAQNPGDFAICVLDQDSLKVEQVAHNTYNCAMKIKEVW